MAGRQAARPSPRGGRPLAPRKRRAAAGPAGQRPAWPAAGTLAATRGPPPLPSLGKAGLQKGSPRRAGPRRLARSPVAGGTGGHRPRTTQPAGGRTKKIQVDILETSVTLSCHWGYWKTTTTTAADLPDSHSWTMTEKQVAEMEKGATYTCRDAEEDLKIYLKVKVCEGCRELNIGLAAVIILSDLLLSLGILLLVYFCSKSRAAAIRGGAGRGRPPGPKEDGPPPVPNPDYEPIRKGQQEVYAGLEPRAF